jgi:hypothetical protein
MMPRLVVLQMNITKGERQKALTPSRFLRHLKNLLPRFFVCFGARETRALSLDPLLRADEATCPMYAIASKQTKPGVGSEVQKGRRGRS